MLRLAIFLAVLSPSVVLAGQNNTGQFSVGITIVNSSGSSPTSPKTGPKTAPKPAANKNAVRAAVVCIYFSGSSSCSNVNVAVAAPSSRPGP